jgi:RNA polymerase sigma factor (TIGR02999 family)
MHEDTSDVTRYLRDWSDGDPQALERLLPHVMEELKRIARRYLDREGRQHTLQPTALVNELYLKLADRRTVHWKNRAQFFGVAADMMRKILVDYARARQTAKRGKGFINVRLDDTRTVAEEQDIELIALDDALRGLAELDPRQARIVELRFFAGLSNEEIGELLQVSPTTIKREWRTARLWLFQQVSRRPGLAG